MINLNKRLKIDWIVIDFKTMSQSTNTNTNWIMINSIMIDFELPEHQMNWDRRDRLAHSSHEKTLPLNLLLLFG